MFEEGVKIILNSEYSCIGSIDGNLDLYGAINVHGVEICYCFTCKVTNAVLRVSVNNPSVEVRPSLLDYFTNPFDPKEEEQFLFYYQFGFRLDLQGLLKSADYYKEMKGTFLMEVMS